MKKILYAVALLGILYSCNPASSEKKEPTQDSLSATPATPPLSAEEIKRYSTVLSSFFDTRLLNSGFNGGILIAKEGYPVYEQYKGYADLRTKTALTDSTSIHIASVSKTFTAVAVLKLVQENKLSLSDSIQHFFPGLPYPGVTVRMLLSHRSGIPNYLYFMENIDWDKSRYATNNDVLQTLYTKPDPYFKPGTRFSYCNTNFVLLAMIVEKITGMTFPQYLQQTIFGPLQMKHTYVFTLADTARAIHSYNYNSTVWDNDFLEGTYGDKNVYSTPRDLLKWDQALYTERLVNKALLDSAFTPHSVERPSVHNYGYGFRLLFPPTGKKVIYHFGRWHGFNAAFARLTDEKVTIIVLGNKYNRGIYTAAHKLYDVFGNYAQDTQNSGEEESETDRPQPVKKKTIAVKKKKRRR